MTVLLLQASGLKIGDYLIAVGNTDVRWASHEQAASLIHMMEDIVTLRVITPLGENLKVDENCNLC